MQRRVAAGVLSAGHARALLGLDDGDAQEQLALRIVAEGLSVRATEELVSLALADGPAKKAAADAGGQGARARRSTIWPTGCRTGSTPGSRSTSAGAKGKITIEFATVDDLERIVGMIGVEEEGGSRQPARSDLSRTTDSSLAGSRT